MQNRVWAIIKREFLTRVKTKGFVIGLVLFPLFLIAIIVVPIWVGSIKSEKQLHLVVIDMTGRLYAPLQESLHDTIKGGKPLFILAKKEIPGPEDLPEIKTELSARVAKKEIDCYLIIPENALDVPQGGKGAYIEFYARNVTDFRLNRTISSALNEAIRVLRFQGSGIDPVLVRQLMTPVPLKTYKVQKSGKEQEDRGFTFGITYILAMSLYIGLIMYGVLIMRSVLEEKNDRVVEMVVSSVRPFQIMAGKLLGVGGVGLLQFIVWALFIALVVHFRDPVARIFGADLSSIPAFPAISATVIVFFVVFFVLGFLLYSTLYAAVGAIVSSEQDAQQLQTPLIIFLIIPILLMMQIIQSPDSQLAVILSMIPFFSPIIMFMRISVLMPPFAEIALSLFILILSIAIMIWLVAKIYRVGILMYGKKPSLSEVLKWIRYG